MTDRLCGIKMTLPPFGARVGLSEFVNCTLCHARAWRRIGSDLCNGVLRTGDDVTAYFSDASQAYTQIDTCNSLFRMPALLDAIDGRLVVSTAFSENPSALLPYCVPLFDFAYAARAVRGVLLFACLSQSGAL